jgi:ABC-type transporter Mla subunit MlaD
MITGDADRLRLLARAVPVTSAANLAAALDSVATTVTTLLGADDELTGLVLAARNRATDTHRVLTELRHTINRVADRHTTGRPPST